MKTARLEIVPTRPQLPQRFKQLRDLAKSINSRWEEIEAERDKMTATANSLACNLRLLGQDLLKAREDIEHGLWLDWLLGHCPKISERTAQVAMRIAKTQGSADLEAANTWAEVYQLIKADRPASQPEPRPWPVVPNLRNLQTCERWTGTIKEAPLSACPVAILDRYRALLEPVARVLWPEKFK